MQRAIDFISAPTTTNIQRIKLAILAAMRICDEPNWVKWAEKWLSGEDRTLGYGYVFFDRMNPAAAAKDKASHEAAYHVCCLADLSTGLYFESNLVVRNVEKYIRDGIDRDAKEWAGEDWEAEAIAEVCYSERGIDWGKLVERTKGS